MDWESIYWRLMPRLYNFFRYRTGDNQVAQDLTASTFEKAWRYRDNYKDDLGSFESWMFAIARNVANDHFRQTPPVFVPFDSIAQLEAEPERDFADLYALLSELPAREQELIALKYGAGMNNRQIATVTQLSESNIGTILHRVIQKLREAWEAQYERG